MSRRTNQELQKNDKLSQDNFLKDLGIQKSFLKFGNFGSSVIEYLEIGMPYMILYESVIAGQDKAVTLEFTESRKNYIYSTRSALKVLGERPLHAHDFYELTIVLSGEVTIQIEDEFVTYHAGDCCLCNRNIHHRELQDHDFELLLFMFKEEYIRSVIEEDILYDESGNIYKKDNIFHRLFLKNEKISIYTAKEYIDFRLKEEFDQNLFFSIINSILKELSEKRSGRSYLIKGYFCRFIELLTNPLKYQVTTHQGKLSREEEMVYQISMILEDCHGHISNEELEQRLNYNRDYINRIVKKRIGKNLSEYKRDFLLKEACHLLLKTDLKISEICETLGYSNRNFFNKLFTEQYGITPSKYRAFKGEGM
ncbi:AraC family transcriptional regulator [Anaerocolumna sp. AGMB13025]|uniref:AraC family transcriptional regulator n=1 Tax=Anaerocolumna sp. AGMB13025 TaxID=3039116 RepID=UPI0024202ED7|nr:AraC family transcriptional regulator [Anaerocolumna sp. AGMB13025]WFR58173.1 AraC family transcriptional regulator [Anaerocolumna sp. AGMB13025]